MPITAVQLPQRSNPGRYGPDGATRLINCYAEDAGSEGVARFPIYANDGWLQRVDFGLGQGPIRQAIEVNGIVYVVAGRSVFSVNASYAVSLIGTVGGVSTAGMVTMARNRAAVPQIGIVVDHLYYIVQGGVLTQVTNANLRADVGSIAALDGFFVLFCDDGRFQLTGVDDGFAIAAIDYATASANPDGGSVVAVRNRDLVLFGPKSVEFFQNTGGTFPFSRGATVDGLGVLAPRSVATLEQTLCFVASDGTVRLLNGYSPMRISSHAVERSINAEADPTLITALSWRDSGHSMYQISGANFTWVYDITLPGSWTEAKSYGINRSRLSVALEANGLHLFGDYLNGALYERRKGFFDEAGSPIVWEIWLSTVHDFPNFLRHDALYIKVLTGRGIVNAGQPNEEPMLMVDYSDDGGATFSAQRMLSLGVDGDRDLEVKTYRLGMAPAGGRVYRLSGSAAAASSILEVWPSLTKLARR